MAVGIVRRLWRPFSSAWSYFVRNLNFYRIHMLVFTFVPLVLSGIFYGANGEFKISYIDSLFLCYSAFTVTGLASINLSTLTPFQQFLLYIQILFGGLVTVSWVMVFIRRRFFIARFEHLIIDRRMVSTSAENPQTIENGAVDGRSDHPMLTIAPPRIIRRVENEPRRIDPSGKPIVAADPDVFTHGDDRSIEASNARRSGDTPPPGKNMDSPRNPTSRHLPRSHTVEFREPTFERTGTRAAGEPYPTGERLTPFASRKDSVHSAAGAIRPHHVASFGGFPAPHQIIGRLFYKCVPGLHRRLTRTLSVVPTFATTTVTSPAYLSFEAAVGRNSAFYALAREQLEELGGVEFRGLTLLLWVVGLYWLFMQLLAFMVVAISASLHGGFDFVFDNQFRYVSPVWFALFFTTSAWSNCGLSLADQGMVQFNTAYGMAVALILVILGGNTGFPIFLRFIIWCASRLVPNQSRVRETLQFLLDHPRRCFAYLFPSRDTWLLALVLVILNSIDWLSIEILDIGNPAIDTIPVGTRIMDGLLQSIAVRTAGFNVVNPATLAPAVRVMITIMMYVSAYPIAMSVRSTNVYEERSLGVEDDEGEDGEPKPNARLGSYLAWHIRHQLAFDVWWLFVSLWLICIIERGNINNPDNSPWFDIFPIFFEIVSAYGTVGLSLGIPTQNYALCGDFSPLSKLVLILVMLRGRHRGLPVAIDRAVMLPYEFARQKDEGGNDEADDSKAQPGLERLRAEAPNI